MTSALKHRPEIDGLRAVAVVPVVLFHAGFGLFSGGYVGVDVFFVISGYLITTIIWGEIQRGEFSIIRFYERRARRIIPALCVVVVAVLAAGHLLLLPDHYRALAHSALAAMLFVSNIYFWLQQGYFSAASELQPLLHTWSLAVEEQFYIAFPLLMFFMRRLSKRAVVGILLALALLSLGLSASAVVYRPAIAFYSLPTRAWELAIGSLLALVSTGPPRSRRGAEAVAAAGLAAIVIPVFLYTPETPFPGLAALPPCLGTAAILYAAHRNTLVGRLLSLPPFVLIGLISYSLYLWHWPIIVMARHYLVITEIPHALGLVLVALAVAMAALATRYVEAPFRNRRKVPKSQIFAFSGFAIVATSLLGVGILWRSGLPGRFAPDELRLASAARDFSPRGKACLSSSRCAFGQGTGPGILLWGDSFAAAMVPTFDAIGKRTGRPGIFAGRNTCPPLLKLSFTRLSAPDRTACIRANDRTLQHALSDPALETVALVAFWDVYLDRHIVAGDRTGDKAGILAQGLKDAVEPLIRSGKRVVIVADLPHPGFDVPWSLALRSHWGRLSDPVIQRKRSAMGALIERAGLGGRVKVVSLDRPLCTGQRCRLIQDGIVVYADTGHLTQSAAVGIMAPYLLESGAF